MLALADAFETLSLSIDFDEEVLHLELQSKLGLFVPSEGCGLLQLHLAAAL